MAGFTPQLQLETLFVLNDAGRVVSTREPNPSPGPQFVLIRDGSRCAWAIHDDVSPELAAQLDALARCEPAAGDARSEPVYTSRYRTLVPGELKFGPTFTFPVGVNAANAVLPVTELAQLTTHFRGWTADELPARSPVLAIAEAGSPVSICFCARRSGLAAEAGVETAPAFRGRGFAGLVTAAWANAILASGRLPIYSTSWSNGPSLAVARKLGLTTRASVWSLSR